MRIRTYLSLGLAAIPLHEGWAMGCRDLGGELRDIAGTRTDERVLPNPGGKGVVWGKSMFRQVNMESIAFGPGDSFRTFAYTSSQGPKIRDAKVIVLFLHGMNAENSNAGAVLNLVQGFARPEKVVDPGSVWAKVHQRSPHIEGVYTEAIDLPGCGNNADLRPLDSLGATVDYYKRYIENVRARSNGQPIVVVGRSYSVGFGVQAIRELPPGMVSGQVLLGGVLPDSGGPVFRWSVDTEESLIERGELKVRKEVQTRANRAYGQLTWGSEKDPFRIPTLVMTGERDPLQAPASRDYYRSVAERNPGLVRYVDVPAAQHGVLLPTPDRPESEVEALAAANDFIRGLMRRP